MSLFVFLNILALPHAITAALQSRAAIKASSDGTASVPCKELTVRAFADWSEASGGRGSFSLDSLSSMESIEGDRNRTSLRELHGSISKVSYIKVGDVYVPSARGRR